MERTFPETKAEAVALPLTWSLKSQSIILLHSMGDKRVSKAQGSRVQGSREFAQGSRVQGSREFARSHCGRSFGMGHIVVSIF